MLFLGIKELFVSFAKLAIFLIVPDLGRTF